MASLPYFTYTETFLDGSICQAWSTGRGRYNTGQPETDEERPCFIVKKDRLRASLKISISSNKLFNLLQPVANRLLENDSVFDLDEVLALYPAFQSLAEKNSHRRASTSVAELRLLVYDFLGDRAVFASFDLGELAGKLSLTPQHLRDMQFLTTQWDLEFLASISSETRGDSRFPPPREIIPESTRLQLQAAIRTGQNSSVAHALEGLDALVDSHTLSIAVKQGVFEIVQTLLDHGAVIDLDTSNEGNDIVSPLATAVSLGSVDLVGTLLDYGADTNDPKFVDVLGRAARYSHLYVVHYLCGRCGDLNYFYAVSFAAMSGSLDVVEYLCDRVLEMGGDFDDAYWFLRIAGIYGHQDIVAYLQDFLSKENFLEVVIKAGNVEGVRQFLDRQPGFLGTSGWDQGLDPPLNPGDVEPGELSFAACVGDTEIMQLLLDRGFHLRTQTYSSDALEFACRLGNISIAKMLASHGAAMGLDEKEFLLARWENFSPWVLAQPVFPDVLEKASTRRVQARLRSLAVFAAAQESDMSEAYMIRLRLRRALKKAHLKFLDKSCHKEASDSFALFGQKSSRFWNVWVQGTSTIRGIMRNIPPSTLDDIVSCLLVAEAMATCRVQTGPDQAEQTDTGLWDMNE
ncbi:ankyrin [Thozetella sp. PMI_491]|nr:ankyrin [Thozetella sp. PMI_491]